jgi:hypothetical protein
MKTKYDLKLHESIPIESQGDDATTYWQCMRMTDGWIYTRWDPTLQEYVSTGVPDKERRSPMPGQEPIMERRK